MSSGPLFNVADDDEVQYLYSEGPESVLCQFCARNLDSLVEQERVEHYAVHFEEQEKRATGSVSKSRNPWDEVKPRATKDTDSDKMSKSKKNFLPWIPDKGDVFWHPALSTPPPANFTPGLISIIKKMLLRTYGKQGPRNSKRAVLCTEGVTHISRHFFDQTWTCGYRNFLMAATALTTQQTQPMYFALLDGDPSCAPSVYNLQRWIEDAWNAGYDPVGAAQLQHKLVGTRKWIGTGEINVAFTYKGIPSKLVDFPNPKGQKSREGRSTSGLLRWVMEYFSSSATILATIASDAKREGSVPSSAAKTLMDHLKNPTPPVLLTRHMPLILQHAGHSRSIVGYEFDEKSGAITLLVFDPGKKIPADVRTAALSRYAAMKANESASSPVSPSPNKIGRAPSASAASPSALLKKGSSLVRNLAGSSLKRSLVEEPIVIDSDDEEPQKPSAKRPRVAQEDDDIEIEEIASPSSITSPKPSNSPKWPEEDALNPGSVLSLFRVTQNMIDKNPEYQILYFPLTEPLTEAQKQRGKTVTSQRILS